MECNVLHLQRNKLTGYVRNPYQMEIRWECIQSWQDKQKASGTGHENSKYSLTMHKTKHFPFFLWRRVWQDLTCNGAYKASTQGERQAAQVWRRDTGMRRETRTPSSRDEASGSTWETRPEKGLWLWQGLWKTSSSEKFGRRRGGTGRTARVQGRWRRMTQPPWLKAAQRLEGASCRSRPLCPPEPAPQKPLLQLGCRSSPPAATAPHLTAASGASPARLPPLRPGPAAPHVPPVNGRRGARLTPASCWGRLARAAGAGLPLPLAPFPTPPVAHLRWRRRVHVVRAEGKNGSGALAGDMAAEERAEEGERSDEAEEEEVEVGACWDRARSLRAAFGEGARRVLPVTRPGPLSPGREERDGTGCQVGLCPALCPPEPSACFQAPLRAEVAAFLLLPRPCAPFPVPRCRRCEAGRARGCRGGPRGGPRAGGAGRFSGACRASRAPQPCR